MALPGDSWGDTLALPRPPVEPRRTGRPWVVVAVGVASIIALVTLAMAQPGFVRPGTDPPAGSSTQDGAQPAGPGMAAVHSMPVVTSSDPPHPPGTAGNTRATGSDPSGQSDQSGSDAGSDSGSGNGSPAAESPSPPPPVQVEAETAIRTGSAAVTANASASGGAFVGGVGDWGDAAGPGTLTFTSVNLPSAGTWRLTIYFINDGPTGPRHATVDVSGAAPHDLLFAGWPSCCGTRMLDLTLSAGLHTVAIGNPTDVGPSIDRLTFTLVPASSPA